MDAESDIEPVTTLRRDAASLIARARDKSSPIVITQNGKATAVLVDVASYERQRRALLLLKLVAQGERDLATGRTRTADEVARHFDRRLAPAKR
jgi:prevent-host-death family protein